MKDLRSRLAARPRWLVLIPMTVLACIALAACGSSSSSSSSVTTSSGSSGNSIVSEAQKVVATADGKLVYSTNPLPAVGSDIQPYGTWRGPSSAPPHQPGKKVSIIVCTKQSPACVSAANGAAAAAKALGWIPTIVDGAGTPQGFAAAWDSAITSKADVIIGIAVPTAAVGGELTKAKQAGIVTVAAGDLAPTSGTAYDAYVPFPMPTMNAILAYEEIARNNGKANTILFEDPGFPVLIQAANEFQQIMKQCSGCKTTLIKMQITDASDPTKVQPIVAGALSQVPDATGIVLPYAIPLPAVLAAVQSAGKAGQVKVVAKDGDIVGLQAVSTGKSPANAGSSTPWAGWAAVDQAVRGLAKKPYLTAAQTGLGVALFTPATAPKNGNIDTWSGLIDYPAHYKAIWK